MQTTVRIYSLNCYNTRVTLTATLRIWLEANDRIQSRNADTTGLAKKNEFFYDVIIFFSHLKIFKTERPIVNPAGTFYTSLIC